MSTRNPTQARAGHRARFSVPQPVRKGLFKYVAITSRRAQLAAWRHASLIVNREADHGFDYSA